MKKMSMSHEDYLEAIVMLAGEGNAVRVVDIANKLDVSKASVTKAISVLKGEGYLEQEHYGTISLTPKGFEYGSKVLARHEALTLFLNKALGIDLETAEEEACQMEHAISDESFEKWLAYINAQQLN